MSVSLRPPLPKRRGTMEAPSAGSGEETHTVMYALCTIFLVCRGSVRVRKKAASAGDFEESMINMFACVPCK